MVPARHYSPASKPDRMPINSESEILRLRKRSIMRTSELSGRLVYPLFLTSKLVWGAKQIMSSSALAWGTLQACQPTSPAWQQQSIEIGLIAATSFLSCIITINNHRPNCLRVGEDTTCWPHSRWLAVKPHDLPRRIDCTAGFPAKNTYIRRAIMSKAADTFINTNRATNADLFHFRY